MALRIADVVRLDPSVIATLGLGDDLGEVEPLDIGNPPQGWRDPWLLGAVHEHAVAPAERRSRGAWYTPRPVVHGLVALAVECADSTPVGVLDPTCGGGAFLLAALDRLVAGGVGPVDALRGVRAMDLDPTAVAVTRCSLALWLAAHSGVDDSAAERAADGIAANVVVGDALSSALAMQESWWQGPQLIVGNPPFGSPLKTGAVDDGAIRFREARAELLGPYADLAAMHLARVVELATPGSTVAMVLPQSVLASRDAVGLRHRVADVAPLGGLWAAREAVFDAGVRACAVIASVASEPVRSVRPVRLASGPDVRDAGRAIGGGGDDWARLATIALGAPESTMRRGLGSLGDLASATAGFRDEHYGLVAACVEQGEVGAAAEHPRLVTVGSVDPLMVWWGARPVRFGGTDRERPVIDQHRLPGKVGGWVERQLRPKVLLATQTKVLEPAVDRRGDLVPSTPLIAVHADPADLDHVAAVLLAPPVVLWAWQRCFGAALSADAVKLAARQLADVPLPGDREAWDEAASLVATVDDEVAIDDAERRRSRAEAVAELMTEAYGAPSTVLAWWRNRLPTVSGR